MQLLKLCSSLLMVRAPLRLRTAMHIFSHRFSFKRSIQLQIGSLFLLDEFESQDSLCSSQVFQPTAS